MNEEAEHAGNGLDFTQTDETSYKYHGPKTTKTL